MSEVTDPPVEGEATPATGAEPEVEKQAFLERLNRESAKRKEAEKTAAQTAKQLAEIQRQMEEREAAGLPELEQLKKRLEQAEKRAAEAEKEAEEKARQVAMSRAERFVVAAAKDFVDADDAVRNVDLSEIESAEDAERAVKRVAKAKPHLLKGDEKPLPGRVLEGGRRSAGKEQESPVLAEAQQLATDLKSFLK